ncbi:MAG: T9SS type A sorting domain-containing protein, partial [Flavobacteriales bacterium]|nr:T9SS type A sorting domain-containing protein [Flavobacteriales bacterium]
SVLTIGGTSGQTPRGLYLDGADVILASGYSIDVVDLDPGTEVLNDTAQNAATFYVRLQEEIVNAVSEFETTSTFYPNPVHSGQALFTGLGRGHVRLLDASGRVRTDLGILTGDRPIAVDLPDGVYLLEWNDGRMQVVRRFVVEER